MNPKSRIYIASAVMLAAGMFAGCTHDFEETNTDPNKMLVGDLQPYGMFENLFYSTAKNNTYYAYYWCNELVQFTACTPMTAQERHRYKISDNHFTSIWSNYATKAGNAVHMYKLGEKFNDDACKAVALTLKVYLLSNLTDIFGDIPYSQAYMGDEGIDHPVFDSQKSVYEQMFAELEKANELYAGKPTFEKPTMDLMYNGDMKLWRKFNNSIYLRLLCRVSGRSEMNVGAKMQEMLDNPTQYPLISSNAENATIKNTGIDPYYNQFRPIEIDKSKFTSNSYLITEQFLKMTLNTEENEQDPRLTTWATKRSGVDDWKGTISGCPAEDAGTAGKDASHLNYEVLVRDDAHAFLMDYSEVQFILAEAALKGLINGGEDAARTYYENAVTASCQKWAQYEEFSKVKAPINDVTITKFLGGKLAGWDNNDNKEKLIAEQKFLSLFWVGMEAYHEIRRTGWPLLTIGDGTYYNNYQFPQRMAYCTSTTGTNPDNVAAALARMGGENNMKTAVWWSIKAITGKFPVANPR